MTSADVAREAGLSRATVSYVLNNKPHQSIPEPTRQRVLDAASRLGYQPFGPARLLRGGKSRVVLFVSTSIHAIDPVEARVVERLADELATHDLQLLWQLGESAVSTASELAPCVILTEATGAPEALTTVAQRLSIPLMPAFPGYEKFIGGSATMQVDHLVAQGHTQIVYADAELPALRGSSEIRWRQVHASCARHGLAEPFRTTLSEDGAVAMTTLEQVVARSPRPTALAAYNDNVAMVALAAAHDLGVSVPDDLAVIGVDNLDVGAHFRPSLTSVVGDFEAFARDMGSLVADVAAGADPWEVSLSDASHVVRRASA